MKNFKANYLRITMHDNDFTGCYENLGNSIKNVLIYQGFYPNYDDRYYEGRELTEEDLEKIKPWIENLWYSIFNLDQNLHEIATDGLKFEECERDYFKVELSIMDYYEVQDLDWDNGESIFVPLFSKDMNILLK